MLCCSLKKNIANIYATVLSIYICIGKLSLKLTAHVWKKRLNQQAHATSWQAHPTCPQNHPRRGRCVHHHRIRRWKEIHTYYIQEKRYQSVQRTARNNRKCIYMRKEKSIYSLFAAYHSSGLGAGAVPWRLRMHISNSVYNKHSAPPPPHVKRLNIYIRMIWINKYKFLLCLHNYALAPHRRRFSLVYTHIPA